MGLNMALFLLRTPHQTQKGNRLVVGAGGVQLLLISAAPHSAAAMLMLSD